MVKNFTISAFLMDEDPECLKGLSSLLSKEQGVTLLGRTATSADAMNRIPDLRPDLLIIGLNSNSNNVFDSLDTLQGNQELPALLFTGDTAEYAVRTIKYQPVDYLLKPVKSDDLRRAITTARYIIQMNTTYQKLNTLIENTNPLNKISFPTKTGFIYLDPDEILYIHADWNYCEAYLAGHHSELLSIGIGKVYQYLPSESFIRLNRSLIINKKYVRKVSRKEQKIILKKDEEEVAMEVGARGLRVMEGCINI